MPKFGQVHFGNVYFGDSEPPTENWKRSYANIPLGIRVRRQLGKKVIFRVRRGNGHAGAVAGIAYQDKYKYVVPSSINNVESTPYRTQWAACVDYWRNILSDDEKEVYNKRAVKGFRMSGYNLFMREAMNGEVGMFVDRGDPASKDFLIGDLTKDGTWYTLDLTAIIPSTARAVLIKTRLKSPAAGDRIRYRRKGNTNEINTCSCEALRANVTRRRMGIIAVNGAQEIEYNADNVGWTELEIIVRGWWT